MDRKKALMVFAGAWVSAALLTWFLYASTKAPHVEKSVALVAASRDLVAGVRLQKSDLKLVHVRENDAPKTAILDEKIALDRTVLLPVSANEPLTLGKLARATGAEGLPATIEIGKRAISVPITDASGVSGLIQPRAHVDVLFTKTGSAADALTMTLLEDVIVLAIGRNTEGTSSATPAPAATAAATQVQRPPTPASATLLVSPEQARKLELAKNGGKISLALRNPLDRTIAEDDGLTTAESLYGESPSVVARSAVRAPKPVPVVQAPPVVEKHEPPPKPRAVVEVFRGEKHSKEVFQ